MRTIRPSAMCRSVRPLMVACGLWLGCGAGGERSRGLQDPHPNAGAGRRIWNQHAYHVTNVREDGTIPAHMAKSWQRLNTFRTDAQFEGTECAPPPPNVR